MKAKLVYESVNFERGRGTKRTMGIGGISSLVKFFPENVIQKMRELYQDDWNFIETNHGYGVFGTIDPRSYDDDSVWSKYEAILNGEYITIALYKDNPDGEDPDSYNDLKPWTIYIDAFTGDYVDLIKFETFEEAKKVLDIIIQKPSKILSSPSS